MSKPIEKEDEKLARKFADIIQHGKNITLLEISTGIARRAAELRGKYSFLKTIDAVQIAVASKVNDNFLTNDKKLKNIKKLKVHLLNDYL